MDLIVKLRARYGQTDILPVNDAAQALADIARTKTLRFDDIRHAVARLGCNVAVQTGDAGTGTVSGMLSDLMRKRAARNDALVPFTGDASVMAQCLRLAFKSHSIREVAENHAFKVATCRELDRTNVEDMAHLAAAHALVDSKRV